MAININVFGEYKREDLPSIALADVTEGSVLEQIRVFLAEENAFLDDMVQMLATRGQTIQEQYGNNFGGRLQNLGEIASVEQVRVGRAWSLGYPIYAYGSANAYRVAYLDEATLDDLNKDVVNHTLMDVETFITEIMRALLGNANYTFNDVPWPGGRTTAYTVYRLANADGTTGSVYVNGAEVMIAALQHYITSGSGTLATGAFSAIRTLLRAVGNDRDIVYLMGRATADATMALSGAVLPANANINDPTAITARVTGPRSRGRTGTWGGYGEVIEWPHWPENYIVGFDRAGDQPLFIREHALDKYRGFQLVQDDKLPEVLDHPLAHKLYRRIFGVGVRNRFNGVALQVTASGTYTAPTL